MFACCKALNKFVRNGKVCIADEVNDLLLPYTFALSIFSHISDPDVVEHIRRVGVTFYERAEAHGER